jgi:C_GCAxxG_C_C family probable redox protein
VFLAQFSGHHFIPLKKMLHMNSKELFRENINCAQSVFVPFAVKFFTDPKLAFKIMSPFGGGISHTDNICGAITGGIAAIGLHLGHSSGTEADIKANCAKATQQFLAEFKEKHGSISCSALLGNNMSISGEREKALAANKFQTICAKIVDSSSELAEKIIKEYSNLHNAGI